MTILNLNQSLHHTETVEMTYLGQLISESFWEGTNPRRNALINLVINESFGDINRGHNPRRNDLTDLVIRESFGDINRGHNPTRNILIDLVISESFVDINRGHNPTRNDLIGLVTMSMYCCFYSKVEDYKTKNKTHADNDYCMRNNSGNGFQH